MFSFSLLSGLKDQTSTQGRLTKAKRWGTPKTRSTLGDMRLIVHISICYHKYHGLQEAAKVLTD
ncbi:uncharacterized protein PHALS_09000 [Plasmopara halstedii]|uniref:Uncharacterized protein n=1 Tax=Plasmopara halstedii TaxID=4781 RepID=A0A0P1AEF2_PLAHL|nr:uncharacterized protein PHALS_09000 [Plasmopara halstedii]CEG38957.1 hypothetical protein PHALS_09000 [Plasmopara halstedii]|eukprot:XP_024575326.1 hypothetical protein PHALS_09000 [Plasmopara halstedii]